MSYRSPNDTTHDKHLIFRETFSSEQEVRKNGGVPTDVTFDRGVATFNGTTSKLKLPKYINNFLGENVFSVRIRIKLNTQVNYAPILSTKNSSNYSGIYYDDQEGEVVGRQFGSARGVVHLKP